MIAKAFEVRDRGTFMPMLAVKLEPANAAEQFLTRRAGFPLPSEFILFGHIEGGHFHYEPHQQSSHTRAAAQSYIAKNFDDLEPGQVIDVEFITGQTAAPKQSERIV